MTESAAGGSEGDFKTDIRGVTFRYNGHRGQGCHHPVPAGAGGLPADSASEVTGHGVLHSRSAFGPDTISPGSLPGWRGSICTRNRGSRIMGPHRSPGREPIRRPDSGHPSAPPRLLASGGPYPAPAGGRLPGVPAGTHGRRGVSGRESAAVFWPGSERLVWDE
jgi:hypothetical protein